MRSLTATCRRSSSDGKIELGLLKRSGIPDKHVAEVERLLKNNDGSPWRRALFGAWGFMLQGKSSLVILHGPRGTGKTQMAACIVKSFCDFKYPARYLTLQELCLKIRMCNGDGPEREDDLIDEFSGGVPGTTINRSLLVIDECHDRKGTGFEDQTLSLIIDKRYRRGVDTILITNETKAEAIQSFGTSIVSRVKEIGGFIECNWPGFRGATA